MNNLTPEDKRRSALGALKDLENAPLIGAMLKETWCQEKLGKIRRALETPYEEERKATMSPALGMKYGPDTEESLDEEFSKFPFGFKADPEDSRS